MGLSYKQLLTQFLMGLALWSSAVAFAVVVGDHSQGSPFAERTPPAEDTSTCWDWRWSSAPVVEGNCNSDSAWVASDTLLAAAVAV